MKTPERPTRSRSFLAGAFLATGLLCGLFFSPIGSVPSYPGSSDATPDTAWAGQDSLSRHEILERLGANAWHGAGYRGQGVKVAVLDSGFAGYASQCGKALPENVHVRSFRRDGRLEARNSQHGILCGEVIHSLAPDAELLLANWEPDHPESFLEAVRWARGQGARVLSCSVIMPSWSDGEGRGAVHQALAQVLGSGAEPGDPIIFASAGNTALRHWSGPFHDDGHGYHEWETGRSSNRIGPWGTEQVSVELCWPAGSAFDLVVDDTTARVEIGHGLAAIDANPCSAVVRFKPQSGHHYQLRVRRLRGTPGRFHLVVLGGGLEYANRNGSIPFPGDGPEVLAVGAVDRLGKRLAYSSCGPEADLHKPELAASVPFPSQWRSRPFTGTSAAAPQAAALAALLWSRHPTWNARQVRDSLRSAARPAGTINPNCETGYGSIHLP